MARCSFAGKICADGSNEAIVRACGCGGSARARACRVRRGEFVLCEWCGPCPPRSHPCPARQKMLQPIYAPCGAAQVPAPSVVLRKVIQLYRRRGSLDMDTHLAGSGRMPAERAPDRLESRRSSCRERLACHRLHRTPSLFCQLLFLGQGYLPVEYFIPPLHSPSAFLPFSTSLSTLRYRF